MSLSIRKSLSLLIITVTISSIANFLEIDAKKKSSGFRKNESKLVSQYPIYHELATKNLDTKKLLDIEIEVYNEHERLNCENCEQVGSRQNDEEAGNYDHSGQHIKSQKSHHDLGRDTRRGSTLLNTLRRHHMDKNHKVVAEEVSEKKDSLSATSTSVLSRSQLVALTLQDKLHRLPEVPRARKNRIFKQRNTRPKTSRNTTDGLHRRKKLDFKREKKSREIATFARNSRAPANRMTSTKIDHPKYFNQKSVTGKSKPSVGNRRMKVGKNKTRSRGDNKRISSQFSLTEMSQIHFDQEKQGKRDGRHGKETKQGLVKTNKDSTSEQKVERYHRVDIVSDGYVSETGWRQERSRWDSFNWNKLVRPASADRLEQHSSSNLSEKNRQLMDQLNGIFKNFNDGTKRVESYYKQIFNGVRYDIMTGTREILKSVNDANDQVYDTVVSATRFARQLIIKSYTARNSQLSKQLQNTEVQIPTHLVETALAEIERRNFKPYHERTSREWNKTEGAMTKIKNMNMQCMQGEAKLHQVRERLSEKYNYHTVKDLFDNLNFTIQQINRGFLQSHSLQQLARQKTFIEYMKEEFVTANNVLQDAWNYFHSGQDRMKRNYDIYNSWKQQQRYRQHDYLNGNQSLLKSVRSLDPWSFQKLKHLVSQAKRHCYDLQNHRNRIDSSLNNLIQAAKASVTRQSNDVALLQLQSSAGNLNAMIKDMLSSFKFLQEYIGSKVKFTSQKICQPQSEGSGWEETSDGDVCDDEFGSGSGQIEDKTLDDEDFTFVSEPDDRPVSAIKQFGLDLTYFTTKLLQQNHIILDTSQTFQTSVRGLQLERNSILSQIDATERAGDLQKDFILDLEDKVGEFQDVNDQIQKIRSKLEGLKRINLRDVVQTAELVAETAKKQHREKDKVPPEKETSIEKEGDGKPEERSKEQKVDYVQIVGKETIEPDKGEKSKEDVNYSELFRKAKEIVSKQNDIKLLRSLAVENCGKIGNHFTHVHSNLSTLREKVDKARQMLTNLQMSISKSGSGYIPVPIPEIPQETTPSLSSSINVCIKPKSLDGTILTVVGNSSVSYNVALDNGKISVTAYDKDNDKLGSVSLDKELKTDHWYTMDIQRIGEKIKVTSVSQKGDVQMKTEKLSGMATLQPLPLIAFVGDVPKSFGITGGSWKGCIGELSVNSQTLTLHRTDSEGIKPSLCIDHCSSNSGNLHMVFSGNGFVLFKRPEKEIITQVNLKFKTYQKFATLLSVTHRARHFNLSVVIHNGALKIESSIGSESDVLLSLNSFFNDGQSHSLKIVYRDYRTYPELDGNREAFSVERASPKILTKVQEGVLVGAFVSDEKQFLNVQYRPLLGCVGDVSINNNRLKLPDALEVFQTYQGYCKAPNRSIWHSCWQWTENSKSLSLGEVKNSNTISFLVSRDAQGPVIHYIKNNKFDVEISITADGLAVSSDDSEGEIKRPQENTDYFTEISITDDGDDVTVTAWSKTMKISYGGFWSFAIKYLSSQSHTVAIGEPKDGKDRKFTGSVTQFNIEDRFYDLSLFSISSILSSCERPLEITTPVKATSEQEEPFSCA